MASLGTLVVNLGANTAPLNAGLSQAESRLSAFSSRASGLLSSAGSKIAGVAAVGATAFAGAAVAGGAWAVKLASDAEQVAIKMEVLTGSAKTARFMIDELRKQAIESPFDSQDLVKAAETMLLFGVANDQVLPNVQALSEISAGSADKLERLSLAFAQSAAAGRLMGQDVLQMVNAGFNPLQEISRRTGESMEQLRKRMEDGLIPFSEVQQAFRDATSEGGRFFGMNAKITNTVQGQWQKLQEQVANLARDIGTLLLPAARGLLEWAQQWVAKLTDASNAGGKVFGPILNAARSGQVESAFELISLNLQLIWQKMVDSFEYRWLVMLTNIQTMSGGLIELVPLQRVQAFGAEAEKLEKQIEAMQKKIAVNAANAKAPPVAAAVAAAAAVGPAAAPQMFREVDFAGLKNEAVRGGATERGQATGAMQRGSAEAFSTIVANLNRSESKQVTAGEKQQIDLLKKINQHLGNGLMPEFQVVEAFT